MSFVFNWLSRSLWHLIFLVRDAKSQIFQLLLKWKNKWFLSKSTDVSYIYFLREYKMS